LLDAAGGPLTAAAIRVAIDRVDRQPADGKLADGKPAAMDPVASKRLSATGARPPQAALPSGAQPPMRSDAGEADRETLVLTAHPDDPGRYETRWMPEREGVFEISVLALGDGLSPSTAMPSDSSLKTTVVAERPQRETRAPWQDEPLLRDLATLSGGRYFRAAEMNQLPAAVPDRREIAISRSPPAPLWDRLWTLLAFAGVVGGEWWLRKRQHLS
jgi:hypothetical protein